MEAVKVIEVRDLVVKAGSFKVEVKALTINRGEYMVIMGPSGAGKTLLLETIAGFRKPERGEIIVDNKIITDLPSDKRGFSYVPQNYALWPHMTVFENIAYGLKARRLSKEEVRKRVLEVAEVIGVKGLLNRTPFSLSGGEQQRVALARALIVNPKAVLLDEPLASLDVKARDRIKLFIRSLHRRLGFTAIHVTHDPVEAAELGSRIAVMLNGGITQIGSPEEVFRNPKTLEIAWLHGRPNIIPGRVAEVFGNLAEVEVEDLKLTAFSSGMVEKGSRVLLLLRPEDVVLSKEIVRTSARNVVRCMVEKIEEKGSLVSVHLSHGLFKAEALITRGAYEELSISSGFQIYASFKASALKALTID